MLVLRRVAQLYCSSTGYFRPVIYSPSVAGTYLLLRILIYFATLLREITVADNYLLCYCCGYLPTVADNYIAFLLRILIYFRPVILFRMTIKGAISCRWCTWDLTATRFFLCVHLAGDLD